MRFDRTGSSDREGRSGSHRRFDRNGSLDRVGRSENQNRCNRSDIQRAVAEQASDWNSPEQEDGHQNRSEDCRH